MVSRFRVRAKFWGQGDTVSVEATFAKRTAALQQNPESYVWNAVLREPGPLALGLSLARQ